jgi:hypothetical protein
MSNVFAWFGANPTYYYLVALTALFSFFTLTVWVPQPGSERRFEMVFVTITFLALFACRWPTFLAPFALNPDESTWAVGALETTLDFAPWRGFDAGTSGPLNAYVPALPALIGAPISFASGRIITTCLIGTAVLALYYTVKWTNGPRVARLAVLPPVILLSLTSDLDFVHYSSEHLSICLTTIALAASAWLAKARGSTSSQVIAGTAVGLCIGGTLFAKLQAVPIAMLVFFFAAVAVVALRCRSKGEARLVAVAMVAALCLIPGIILLSLWWTGLWRDAFLSYIRMNLIYMADSQTGIGPAFFFRTSAMYTAFLVPSLLVILFGMISLGAARLVKRSSLARGSACVSAASILLLLAALFVIYEPHRPFAHYLLFSIVPVSFCVSSALGFICDPSFGKRRASTISIWCAALFVLPALSVAMASGNPFIRHLPSYLEHRKSEVALSISRYAKPGDSICVWGWASEYYIETETFSAAREPETGREIEPSPHRDYFRRRYLLDLRRRKPVVFVDAVAPSAIQFRDRALEGHETFPALGDYIRDQYELKEEISGVRIYAMKTPLHP